MHAEERKKFHEECLADTQNLINLLYTANEDQRDFTECEVAADILEGLAPRPISEAPPDFDPLLGMCWNYDEEKWEYVIVSRSPIEKPGAPKWLALFDTDNRFDESALTHFIQFSALPWKKKR